jgi:uncharacterized protein (DUF983 family)
MDEMQVLDGRPAQCPDCGQERWFAPVAGPEFCCTACDAALLMIDVVDNTDNTRGSTAA